MLRLWNSNRGHAAGVVVGQCDGVGHESAPRSMCSWKVRHESGSIPARRASCWCGRNVDRNAQSLERRDPGGIEVVAVEVGQDHAIDRIQPNVDRIQMGFGPPDRETAVDEDATSIVSVARFKQRAVSA